jgi:hypothetical protein
VTVSKNGLATINLKGLLNVASIKLYVVAPNNNGEYLSNGEVLSFENITIVADGEPGIAGVDGKDGQDGKDGVDGKDGEDGKDGQDGKDGSGIEYVFLIANETNKDIQFNILLSSAATDPNYQQDDFYPNKDNGYIGSE